MAKLIIEINDSLLAKALIESKEQQVDLDSFINGILIDIFADTDLPTQNRINVDYILQKAISQVQIMLKGKEFNLVEISDIDDWNELSNRERQQIGRNFRAEVEGKTNNKAIAQHMGFVKNSRKALYKRI
jgi:hypothetical protein